jgi:hypothetical protein
MVLGDYLFLKYVGHIPVLKNTWYFGVIIALIGGSLVTLGCGGAMFSRRIISAVVWGVLTAILYTGASALFIIQGMIPLGDIITAGFWWVVIFAVLAPIGAVVTELRLPAPS